MNIIDFKSVIVVDNIDVIIHLAAKINVEESIKDPQETFGVNVQVTINLFEACSKKLLRNKWT